MSQIFRAMRFEVTEIGRFYGIHRNMHSHYETLRIRSDATPREIRSAFIKLSKEMHPDTSKKASHKDFIKISEAYRVLSKRETKDRYDSDLRCGRSPNGRPVRVVYYNGEPSYTARPSYSEWHGTAYDFTTTRGGKRVSAVTIAMLCILLSSIGAALQFLIIGKTFSMSRDQMLTETAKHAKTYKEVRERAANLSMDQQIAAFEKRAAEQSKR